MSYSYLDGVIALTEETKISISDRGFLLSDGFFETALVMKGTVSFFTNHFNRIQKSSQELKIPFSYSEKGVKKIINDLYLKSHYEKARLRITVTRGSSKPGLSYDENINSRVIFTLSKYDNKQKQIKLCTKLFEPHSFPSIKTIDYLFRVLALQEASQKNFDEVLFLDKNDLVKTCTVCNIFMIKGKTLYTPSGSDFLHGITRNVVISLAKELCFNIKEIQITLSDLYLVEEIFVTSSLKGIIPVVQVDENKFSIGESTRLLQQKYKSVVEKI